MSIPFLDFGYPGILPILNGTILESFFILFLTSNILIPFSSGNSFISKLFSIRGAKEFIFEST